MTKTSRHISHYAASLHDDTTFGGSTNVLVELAPDSLDNVFDILLRQWLSVEFPPTSATLGRNAERSYINILES